MYFIATFSEWVDNEQPGMEKAKPSQREFIVEADNKEQAMAYAKRFEGIETNAYEGLSRLLLLEEARLRDIKKFSKLSIFESYLR